MPPTSADLKLDGSEATSTFLYTGYQPTGIAIDDVVLTDPAASPCPLTTAGGCAPFGGVDHAAQISFIGGRKPRTKLKLTRGDLTVADLGNPTIPQGTSFRLCVYVDDALVGAGG